MVHGIYNYDGKVLWAYEKVINDTLVEGYRITSGWGAENWCMIGYHSIPVLADAIVKGISGYNPTKVLNSCLSTANNPLYPGVSDYRKYGYVPEDHVVNAASITLEYAYDDFTLAQLADAIAQRTLLPDFTRFYARQQSLTFLERSWNFLNVFDTIRDFVRPRNSDGSWKEPFYPLSTHGQGFIEGNSWNYFFYVPHDIPALIGLMGGEEAFIRFVRARLFMRSAGPVSNLLSFPSRLTKKVN